MVGICNSKGKLYLLRKRLLQDWLARKYIRKATTNSITIVIRNDSPAIFNEVNLSILMNATIIHRQIISLRIMFLELQNQPITTPVPIIRLTTSSIRNQNVFSLKNVNIKGFRRIRKSNSLAQIPTPIIPATKVIMYKTMVMTSSLRQPIMPPKINAALKTIINHTFTLIPWPPKDHAREQRATMAIRMVMTTICIIKPHSKVLVRNSQLHLTQYVSSVEQLSIFKTTRSKQLKKFMSYGQLLQIVTVQPGGWQTVGLQVGMKFLCTVEMLMTVGFVIPLKARVQGVLVVRDYEDWLQVQRGVREQSKVRMSSMNVELGVPLVMRQSVALGTLMVTLMPLLICWVWAVCMTRNISKDMFITLLRQDIDYNLIDILQDHFILKPH